MTFREITNSQFWRKTSNEKEAMFDIKFKRSIKDLSYELRHNKEMFIDRKVNPRQSTITSNPFSKQTPFLPQRTKIAEYVTHTFKDKFNKFDIQSFIVYLTKEFYYQCQKLRMNYAQFDASNKDQIIAFFLSFYDFYEDDLVFSLSDTIKVIIKEDKGDSFLTALNNIVLLSNVFDVFSLVLMKENGISDIGIVLLHVVYVFQKIISSAHVKDEDIKQFISKSTKFCLPNFITYLVDLLSFQDKTTISFIIEKDELCFFFNDLSNFIDIRRCIYDIFLQAKNSFDEHEKAQFQTYIEENKCLEGILSSIKNTYIRHEYDDIGNILQEITTVLMIHFTLCKSFDNSDDIFQLLLVIFDNMANSNCDVESLEQFLQKLFDMTFLDNEELKSKCRDKDKAFDMICIKDIVTRASSSSFSGNIIKNYNVLSFFLDLFEMNIPLRKSVATIILDRFTNDLSNYKTMTSNEAFYDKFVANLYQCNEEIISFFFLFLFAFSEGKVVYPPIKELKCLIMSLHKCTEYHSVNIMMKNLKMYIEMKCKDGDLQELSLPFFKETYEIIKDVVTPNIDILYTQEMLLELIEVIQILIGRNRFAFVKFKEMQFIGFFNQLVSKYTLVAYRIWTLLIENEKEASEIEYLVNFLFERFDSVTTGKLIKPEIITEVNYLNECMTVFFYKSKAITLLNKEKMIHLITQVPGLFNRYKESSEGGGAWNTLIQTAMIKYLDTVMHFIQLTNRIIFNKEHKECLMIDYGLFKKIVNDIFALFATVKEKEYLRDLIKYLIDKALNFKLSEGSKGFYNPDSSDKLLKSNFTVLYINKHIISTSALNNCYSTVSNYSNFALQSPLLILLTLKGLIRIDQYIDVYLEFVEFLCKLNENNAKVLLKASLLKTLLKITLERTEHLPRILNILEIVTKFFSQADLETIFEFLLIHFNEKPSEEKALFLNRILVILHNSFNDALNHKKSLVLTYINPRQPNIYNFIYTSGVKLSQSSMVNNTRSKTESNEHIVSIYLSMKFHTALDKTKFTLLRIEKESKDGKDQNTFEISIENVILMIKENDVLTNSSNDLTNTIFIGKQTDFLIEICKETNKASVFINNKPFLASPSKFLDTLHSNSTYSIMTGYSGFALKEIYDDKFMNLPHVSMSYSLMYLDKLSTDLLYIMQLIKINSSKIGSMKANQKDIHSLSKNGYQKMAPTQEQTKINVSLPIDIEKIAYELVVDNISLISYKTLSTLIVPNDQLSPMNFLTRLERHGIQLSSKYYLEFISKTNNMVTSPVYSNTYLIAKYDIAESFSLNWIYEHESVKKQILTRLVFNGSSIDYEVNGFRIIKFLIMLLNEAEGITNDLTRRDIVNNIIKLLCLYFVINLPELDNFNDDCSYFKSLLMSLYKNARYISKEGVEMLFYLSYAFDGKRKEAETRLYNPWYIKIITCLLMNDLLFNEMPKEAKAHLLDLIKKQILLKDFTMDNYNLSLSLLKKLLSILLMCNKSDQSIDNDITDMIIYLIDQILKIKKGIQSPSTNQTNKAVNLLAEFISITSQFDLNIKEHLDVKPNDMQEISYEIINEFFTKLFTGRVKVYREKIIGHLNSINLSAVIRSQLFKNLPLLSQGKEGLDSYANIQIIDGNGIEEPMMNNINLPSCNDLIKNNNDKEADEDNHSRRSSGLIRKEKKVATIVQSPGMSSTPHKLKSSLSFNFHLANKEKDNWAVVTPVSNIMPQKTLNYELNDQRICMGNCYLCNFIRRKMKKEYNLLKSFMSYKMLIVSIFHDLFLINERKEDYLKEKFSLSFSWCLDLKEGPARMRKKMVCRLDSILNEEIDRCQHDKAKEEEEKEDESKGSGLQEKFTFYDMKAKLDTILGLDQIFDIGIVKKMMDCNDSFDSAYNCLMFKGMASLNSVLIIGKAKVYICNNINIDHRDLLYSCQKPFKRIFWTLNDYNDMLSKQCSYLNSYTEVIPNDSANANEEEEEEECKKKDNKFTSLHKEFKVYSFSIDEINEIFKRKFLHQDNAIEIFLNNGKNYLLAFNTCKRDLICNKIVNNFFESISIRKKHMTNAGGSSNSNNESIAIPSSHINWKSSSMIFLRNSKLFVGKQKGKHKKNEKAICDIKSIIDDCQDKWSQGFLSNFSYLMILNTLSGRSYNDLSQYPVYPWILKDYTNETINLIKDTTYRNFSFPIYAQEESSREILKIKYESAEAGEGKYHSGSHYSNPGFTTYYLVRIKPFATIAAEIQGGCFDTSDRLFFNIKNLYSINDKYQELIPDIFQLPELFKNFNNFKFGLNQNNEEVNDVILPNWAMNDPRLFSKMTKKAMESEYVSQKINDWIDLIFGYKQKGSEAAESYNVLREVCTAFDPNGLLQVKMKEMMEGTGGAGLSEDELEQLYEEVEFRTNEICDMGQNPMQLFSKTHPKKERHQKIIAFFSRSVYLMNFKPKEKEYKIKLETQPYDMHSYYEISSQYLSHGEGGLSSFRMFYNPSMDDQSNQYQFIYFIVGKRKTLLAPTFKNYIDYSQHKYSFAIVKPYSRIGFEFSTNRPSPIALIKATNDGKHIIIGFQDGCLCKYKIKKLNEVFNHPDIEKKKESKGLMSKLLHVGCGSSSSSSTNTNPNDNHHHKEGRRNSLLSSISGIGKKQSTPMDAKINRSTSNVANTDTFLSTNHNFIQLTPFIRYYNTIDFKDYHTHAKTKSQNDLKQLIKTKEKKPTKMINVLLVNTNTIINSPIALIELCECFSMMLVVDIANIAYLFDLNSFELIKRIDYNKLTKGNKTIRFISICPYTGDFLLATSYQVVYFNLNGVVLALLDIRTQEANAIPMKITCCLLKSLPSTESDSYVFTGHNDGNISIWKIENKYENEAIDSYRFAYDKKYYNEVIGQDKKIKEPLKLQLTFDILIKIKCSNASIVLMKITEDLSQLIVITKENNLLYLSYEDFLDKKKKSKQIKTCPQCLSPIGSSKILCHLCNKKLCSNCKIERKIPEYSLKTPKPICEDCFAMITSTNKMLYDF